MFFFLFAQARYYLPETGRFISEDSYKGTLPDTQSQNRYIYCTNNPLKYVDPSGHHPEITKWLTPIPIVGAAYNVGEGIYHVATGTDPEDGWEEWQGRTNESAMWTAGAGEAIAWYKMTGFTVLGITKFTKGSEQKVERIVTNPVFTQDRGSNARTTVVTPKGTTTTYPTTNTDTYKDTGRYGINSTDIRNINKGLGKNTKGTKTKVSDTSKGKTTENHDLKKKETKPETGNTNGNGKTTKISGGNINHANGAIAEAHGMNQATKNGEICIQSPGKVTASGPDFVTYDSYSEIINVYDSKYSFKQNWPNKAKGFGSKAWLDDIQKSINNIYDPVLKQKVQKAFDNKDIAWKIFQWPY
jgi:hypothetical protein